jgi:hypothetical protein
MALMPRSPAKSAIRGFPPTIHFLTWQLGSQEWFTKQVKEPRRVALITTVLSMLNKQEHCGKKFSKIRVM